MMGFSVVTPCGQRLGGALLLRCPIITRESQYHAALGLVLLQWSNVMVQVTCQAWSSNVTPQAGKVDIFKAIKATHHSPLTGWLIRNEVAA